MDKSFDPLGLKPNERSYYSYEGPEIIYTFWAKHGPCQVTGCGHRTPIMTTPIVAVKTFSVKHWAHQCVACGGEFHIEEAEARMAPDVPLVVSPDEPPYSILDAKGCVSCPHCNYKAMIKLGKGANKKVDLTLLVHSDWLAGSRKNNPSGQPFGGSAQDDVISTSRWNAERASKIRLLEVRGALPASVTCPGTDIQFSTGKEGGTVPKKSSFACGSCGTVQNVLATVKESGKTGPSASYAIQGYSPRRSKTCISYNG